MNKYKKQDKENSRRIMKVYRLISELTGIRLEDTVKNSYCFVKNGELKEKLFGKIGVYDRTEGYINYFKFKSKKDLVGFDTRGDDIFWAINPVKLIEERKKMFNN